MEAIGSNPRMGMRISNFLAKPTRGYHIEDRKWCMPPINSSAAPCENLWNGKDAKNWVAEAASYKVIVINTGKPCIYLTQCITIICRCVVDYR
jgi:hypothetical protein